VTLAIRDLGLDRQQESVQKALSSVASIRSSMFAGDHEPQLSEFPAEEEAVRAVPIEPPPPRSWKPVALSVLVLAIALGAGATLVFLYLQSRAWDVSVVQLPTTPPRPLPTLSTPGVPAAWMIPGAGRTKSTAGNGSGVGVVDRFAIQVASFNTLARAQALVDDLARDGHKARAVTLDFGPPRGQLVQVLVGEYRSIEEAQADLTRLREQFDDARLERVLAR
jgi:cell division septation protein DedD